MNDVIIVGCGTVGLTIANLLASLGLKICLIEKNHHINQFSNAVGINDECLLAWKICGILQEIAPFIGYNEKGQTILKYLDEEKNELMSLKQSIGFEKFPKGVVFLQNKIDEILLKNLAQRVEVNFSQELISIKQNQELVTVKTANKTYQARYLIAADGKESAVREMLGIKFKQLSKSKDEWLVLNLVAKTAVSQKRFVEVFCGLRSLVSCPLPNNQQRLEISLRENEREILSDEEKISQICSKYFDLKNYQIINKFKIRFLTAIAEKYFEKNVVLCGDAAHCTSPFASAGLVCGIRDSLVLYNMFRKNNVSFAIYQKLRYKKQMRSLRLAMILEKIMRPNPLLKAPIFLMMKFFSKSAFLVNLLSIRGA